MSDYQQIPGSIRSFLATSARTWTEHSADLATVYATLCDETNERLRRCAEYLRRGMDSSAIHLAECQPNLVNAVAALQFPERSDWAEICITHGVPAPPVLEAECLHAIQAACEREKRLQPLLSRHRLLAIAKAPAAVRLDVAWRLAEEEAANPAWAQEIASLESARLQEIDRSAHTALQDRDELTIQALWEELTGPRWRRDIPAEIHDSLHRAVLAADARRAQADLPEAAAQIVSAFAEQAPPERLNDLIARWKKLAATPGVAVPDDLAAKVEPTLAWQAGEARRQKKLEEVRPLQQLAAAQAPAAPRSSRWNVAKTAEAIVAVLLGATAIGYGYWRYMHK